MYDAEIKKIPRHTISKRRQDRDVGVSRPRHSRPRLQPWRYITTTTSSQGAEQASMPLKQNLT